MKFVIIEEGTSSELSLERPVISIGRAVDNDIRLASTLVSRHHCRIEVAQGGAWVLDLGSSNGTVVNGEKVTRRLLEPGDRVQVGGARILVQPGAGTANAQPPSETQPIEIEPSDVDLGLRTLTGEARRERDNLLVFARITRELVRETDVKELLRTIVDSAVSLVGGERGFLLLSPTHELGSDADDGSHEATEPETPARDVDGELLKESPVNALRVRVGRSFDRSDIPLEAARVSIGIARQVFRSGRPLLSVDAGRDERFDGMQSVEDLRLRSVMCLPIRIEDKIEGVLYVDNRLQQSAFSEADLELLELFSNQAAMALLNARRVSELKEHNRRLTDSRRQIERLNAELGRKVRDRDTELSVVRAELGRARGRYDYTSIVGGSDGMHKVFQQIDRLVESDLPVLIQGESGTGKELIARAIHFNGPRSAKAFVTENCAALPDTLLESELFGHARGAFTGAHKQKRGLLEQADGGTLFLDEIGDMSVEMQKKLLRVLQEGEFRPVGSDQRIQVNVRLLCASNRDLEDLVREGKFREDLFFRVNVLAVNLPALRERRDDIPLLAEHLLARAAREANRPVPTVTHEVTSALMSHDWPGNVRELENEMRRLIVLAQGEVKLEHLSRAVLERRTLRGPAPTPVAMDHSSDIRAAVAELERRSIEGALARAGGNKSKAASELGISRFALQRKLDKYDLLRPKGAEGTNGAETADTTDVIEADANEVSDETEADDARAAAPDAS